MDSQCSIRPKCHPLSSVCSVSYSRYGTGSIVKLKISEGAVTRQVILFIAPFHVVPIYQVDDVDYLTLKLDDKNKTNVTLDHKWVQSMWIYKNDLPNDKQVNAAGITQVFEDKKIGIESLESQLVTPESPSPIQLDLEWVKKLWEIPNYKMHVTVIEFKSDTPVQAIFKHLSPETGEKNGIYINTVLQAYLSNSYHFSICNVEYCKSGTGSIVSIQFPKQTGM